MDLTMLPNGCAGWEDNSAQIGHRAVSLEVDFSYHWNLAPGDEHEIVVEDEQGQKGHEQHGPREQVPQVVVVEKVHEDALLVEIPRYGRRAVPVGVLAV